MSDEGSRPATGSSWGLLPSGDGGSGRDPSTRFEPRGRVGAGGMGQVEVVLDRWLEREVARKLPADGVDAALGAAVIRHEAVMTAALDHPHIVPLLDTGETEDGRPWFTMRYVRGRTLEHHLLHQRDVDLDPTALRLLLRQVLQAAQALAHAHGRGIVHGDFKPANVVIGARGEVQVIDWGLAMYVDPGVESAPRGRGAGTPRFVAPEVQSGAPPSPRSDVFALGVTLGDVLACAFGDGVDGAPRDLVALATRAASEDPTLRYPDAAAFADDLARWLDGAAVDAHRYGAVELLWLLVRRWRRPLAVTAAVVVFGVGMAAWSNHRTRQERDRAVEAEHREAKVAATLLAKRAEDAARVDDAPRAWEAATAARAYGPSPLADGVLAALSQPPVATRVHQGPDLGCDEVLFLDAGGPVCTRGGEVVALTVDGAERWRAPGMPTDAAPLADGRVVWLMEQRLEIWDPSRQVPEVVRLPAGRRGLMPGRPVLYVDHVSIQPVTRGLVVWRPCPADNSVDTAWAGEDGAWWTVCSGGAVVSGAPDGRFRTLPFRAEGLDHVVALSGAGDRLFAGSIGGQLGVIDPQTGRTARVIDTALGTIRELLPHPDGTQVLVIDEHGSLSLWRPGDGILHRRLASEGVGAARWTGPDTFEAVARGVETWSVTRDAAPDHWREAGGISALVLDPLQQRVAVAVGPDLVVRSWPDGGVQATSDLHDRVIKDLAFSPDGQALATGAVDAPSGLALWPLDASPHARWPEGPRQLRALAWVSPTRLLTAGWAPALGVVDVRGEGSTRQDLSRVALQLERRADGDVVLLDEGGTVWRVDETAAPVRAWQVDGARGLALARDEDRVAVLASAVQLRRLSTGELLGEVSGEGVTALGLSADGTVLLTGALDGTVRCWEVATGILRWQARLHVDQVSAVVPLDDGWLTAGWDGRVQRWGEGR